MRKPLLKFSRIKSWNEARQKKKKEKEEFERAIETPALKMTTLIITLIAMATGLSFLPLFPQPLPILIGVLIAFATYKNPRLGMPVGGFIIGLGLLYHLADLYFISFLGETPVRVAFILIWMTLFVILPLIFNRYKSALAIDFGILAFAVLFFEPIYFLAIPLILSSAVFFKKYVALTTVYYVLLTVPLQLSQYYQYTVLPIVRDDWWVTTGSSPPVFVPLAQIAKDLTSSIDQFRLYDTSQVIYSIAGQTTWIPDWTGRTIEDALTQYLDSLPGILMFVVIVAGLALTLVFFTKMLVKEGIIGHGDRFFPCFTATIAAALFFVLLSALQKPLAFTAEINGATMLFGILGTTLLTSPVLFMEYSPKRRATSQEVVDKAQNLLNKVTNFENKLNIITENLPVNISSLEGKLFIIKDSVHYIVKKASLREFDQFEVDEKFDELDKIAKTYENLEIELQTILVEYQIFSNCEFSNWVGKLRTIGLEVKTNTKIDFQREITLEQRVEAIKQVIDAGRAMTREISEVAEPIYNTIRIFYDSGLPQKSTSINFASEKLSKNESPWIAVEALYNALNNWLRQYGAEIKVSLKFLHRSLKPMENLSSEIVTLSTLSSDDALKVLGYAKKAEGIKTFTEKMAEEEQPGLVDFLRLFDYVQGFLVITNGLLSMLYSKLISVEEEIAHLLPTEEYLWEKNIELRDRLEQAVNILSKPSKYQINEIMVNLPKYIDCIAETVKALVIYTERKEFLLNYPLAEFAITESLKHKKQLLPQDLPFQSQFAEEYLRLYYTQRFGEYMFDKENSMLKKR